jgi:hydroxyacyl-ACP dehydratase HTD2-like protein with hotdog domain
MTAQLPIEPGMELPSQRRTPTEVELFLYAAAVWLPHRIHYDHPYTTEVEGQPGLLVQGPLQAIYLDQLVRTALDDGWRITGFTYRHRAPAFAGDELTCSGTITAVSDDGGTLRVDVSCTRPDGTVTTSGELTLAQR